MSSKAKNLGTGSFGQARAVSARRAAIGAATSAPTVGVPDPTELTLDQISQNPDNPRQELRELEGLAASISEIGLVNAITVATMDAYLAERPDRADEVDEGARYIVIDGHRRLEAARRAGVESVRVSLDNRLVASDESLLEAAFVANVHRDDMNPLEEAQALRKLVEFYGSQNKAAKRLGMAQSTISSKLSVLDLDPQLQSDLLDGSRKVEHVRNLAKYDAEQQRELADQRAAAAEERRRVRKDVEAELSRRDNPEPAAVADPDLSRRDTPEPGADLSRRDNPTEAADLSRRDNPADAGDLSRRDNPAADEGVSRRDNPAPARKPAAAAAPVAAPASAPVPVEDVPRPRPEAAVVSTAGGEMPWGSGDALAQLIIDRMTQAEIRRLTVRLIEHNTELQEAREKPGASLG
ncbi:ParB/RepB/Spo0J family partition protein [Streptomyces sp. NPDC001941]|uniref:ParB/RepB/Spo0J family partition protein n=1 Tax=Streptomyces sp. NPDC001941 TaxID=3154659 RepID=UPI00332B2FA8